VGEGEDSCTNYRRGKERRKEDEQRTVQVNMGTFVLLQFPETNQKL
jgi:hypothetical protein